MLYKSLKANPQPHYNLPIGADMNMTAAINRPNKIDENEINDRIEILEDRIRYMKKGYGWIETNKPLCAVKLELIFDASGLSQERFAQQVGITQPTLSRMIAGKSISKAHLVEIATHYNLTMEWLLGLEDKPQPKLHDNILSLNTDNFVIVSRYVNQDNQHHQDTKNTIMIHDSILKFLPFDYLRFITQNDRSMSPDILPGAAVVFNTSHTSIENGEMYVVEIANQFSVKTIFVAPDGSLNLKSKMQDYPDYCVQKDDPNVRILGRVVTVTNIY